MGMQPEQYFESFVEGNFEDFRENPSCIRKAFNAAVSASHLADNFFEFNKRHNPDLVSQFDALGDFVKYLNKETNDAFKDIRGIANAYKHLYADTKKHFKAHATVLSGGAIESITFEGPDAELIKIMDEFENETSTQEMRAFVQFTRKDGTKAEMLPVLKCVVDFWFNFIY